MDNKRRDELMKRLTTRKKKLAVAIIDELAEEYSKTIVSEIDVTSFPYSIDDIIDFEEFDVIFFDSSYKQGGVSSIDILEKLIQRNPELEEKCRVLIGKDIIEWGRHNDPEIKELVARVKSLPNIVYGEDHGSKIELMIRLIEQVGRKKDIEVPKKAPEGICRKEVLQAVKPYLEQIEKNLNEQKELGTSIRGALRGIEPENEYERNIIKYAQGVAGLFTDNRHIISQEYYFLSRAYKTAEKSRNAAAEEAVKKEEQGQDK